MKVIKEWPRLFTLDSKGKVRIFDCKVVEDIIQGDLTGFDFVGYDIITSTGLLTGKLTDQKEKVKDGKNKGKKNQTDALSQALLQADSLWIGKTNEGYKSKQILTLKLVDIGINNLYEETILANAIKHLPQWAYTNSNWDELPMLAHPLKKVKSLSFPILGQPKLNGVRCLAKCLRWDNEFHNRSGSVTLISRGGQYYKVTHIQRQLADLCELLDKNGISNIILDGELYKHGIPLQEISGAARKENEDGLFTSNSWLEYHIYDVIDTSKPNMTQGEREELRMQIYDVAVVREFTDKFPNIKFINTSLICSKDEIDSLHNKFVADGYEGLILRNLSSSYKFNERSTGLLKVKEFKDEEFEIIGYEVDPNKSVEESFVFILKNNEGKMTAFGTHPSHTFKARPTGTDAMKMKWYQDMLENKHIGKKATVRYFERSKEGVPTMGHVRADLCDFLHIRPSGE